MPTYVFTFKSLIADPVERAGRLKMFVKHAKRYYGLKLTNVEEKPPKTAVLSTVEVDKKCK